MARPTKGAMEYIFHHTVLPPGLPQHEDANIFHDNELIHLCLSSLEAFQTILETHDLSLAAQVESVAAMLKNLLACRDVSDDGSIIETQLATQMHELKQSSPSPLLLEIKAQNAGLLVTRTGEHIIFEAFELSPTNHAAMSTKGRLIRAFPTAASRIPVETLDEEGLVETLSQAIAKMSFQKAPGFQPIVRKAGEDEEESRDSTHPGMVTDFLLTFIAANGSPTDMLPGLIKKTTEEVLWSNAKLPWRRSPLWLLLRVGMQLTFSRLASDNLYKPFMALFFSKVLDVAQLYHCDLRSERLYLISAKLARRTRKISASNSSFKRLASYQQWMDVISSSLNRAHDMMSSTWKAAERESLSSINTARLNTLKPSEDLDTSLDELDDFISEIANRKHDTNASRFQPSSEFPQHSPDNVPDYVIRNVDFGSFELAAVEKWIEDHLGAWIDQNLTQPSTCKTLFDFLQSYHSAASSIYAAIPVSFSYMCLCISELWVACDKSACKIYPLLRNYDPELQLEPLQALSLPERQQMQRLSRVEQYVQSRRNASIRGRPSVLRDFGHSLSFAVKYFDRSPTLQALRSQVLQNAAVERQQKREELAEKRARYTELMKAYDDGKCEYFKKFNRKHGIYKPKHKERRCGRCQKRSEANALAIAVHEWPLSSCESIAKGTIFELCIPPSFGQWRDATIYLAKNVLGFAEMSSDRPRSQYTLSNHRDLSSLSSVPGGQRVTILSQNKPHAGTHRKVKDGISFLTETDVLKPTGLSYEYYDSSDDTHIGAWKSTDRISKHCTYTLPNRSSQLQDYVQPRAACIPPNHVIATLSESPSQISLDEYKAFGSLPLGYSVRFLNILAQLAMPTVDFAKAETHCLILQTIHNAGPPPSDDREREGQRILFDNNFSSAVMQELEKALERVTENWEIWRGLAVFIQIALKILSFSTLDEIHSRCFDYLHRARRTCNDWLSTLRQRLQTTTVAEERAELCSRITEIALLCTTTFNIDEIHIDQALSSRPAVFALLHSSISVQENEKDTRPEHEFLHLTMLQSWKATMYRVLPYLVKGILSREEMESGLNDAVTAAWGNFRPNVRWKPLRKARGHWLHTSCGQLNVHLNLLTAELLVDGRPLSRLPTKYLRHTSYDLLFEKASIEIVPTDEPGMEVEAKHQYRGHKLFFGMVSSEAAASDMLVVAEHEQLKFDFIPPRLLNGYVPDLFVSSYVHWYNRSSEEIEFRSTKDPWDLESTRWFLRKHRSAWRLVKENVTLVNIASETASILSEIFAPLENKFYIHPTFNNRTSLLTIELPRLRLLFSLQAGTCQLQSREFRGMIVDPDQSIGSLTGLSNKLVLHQARDANERCVLIPEGSVSVRKSSNHVNVRIDPESSVKVHDYTIDTIIGRIVDNDSLQSKLYLALLHAVTSHCLPDSLTGRTGTESALTILRSGAVKSFSPLKTCNLAILARIADLAPGRRYYPEHVQDMQEITWNPDLPYLSQDSDLYLAVETLYEEAQKMEFCYPRKAYTKPSPRTDINSDLMQRDMIRGSKFRVDGFGAEHFSTSMDKHYPARHKAADPNRSQRSYIAASLILRHDDKIHSRISASALKGVLTDLFRGCTVNGPSASLNPADLRFDVKWLQEASSVFDKNWLTIHSSFAKVRKIYNRFDIMMWLSTTAFAKSANIDIIQVLAAFYNIPDFDEVENPKFDSAYPDSGDNPEFSGIESYCEAAAKPFNYSEESQLPKHSDETYDQAKSRREFLFNQNKSRQIEALAEFLAEQWPCAWPTKPANPQYEKYINVDQVMEDIQPWYKVLHDNRRFGAYLDTICSLMGWQLADPVDVPLASKKGVRTLASPNEGYVSRNLMEEDIFNLQAPGNLPEAPKLDDLPREPSDYLDDTKAAQEHLELLCDSLDKRVTSAREGSYVLDLRKRCASYLQRQCDSVPHAITMSGNTTRLLEEYQRICSRHLEDLSSALADTVGRSTDVGTKIHQSPRISPSFWLRQLNNDRYNSLSTAWKSVMVRYGLAVTEVQRSRRLVKVSSYPHPQDLVDELNNPGHQNWDPAQFPERLLFEADTGMLIRPVQEEISMLQRQPPHGRNVTMQLNMGEGKSSVIVPTDAAVLADGETLLRVIVGKPQTKQMFQMLVFSLGRLSNRRIYHLPFSRALKLTLDEANTIFSMMQDCQQNRGILLVQPEHILSLKLMGIESVIGERTDLGRSLLRTQQLFDTHARDIVDECDENFSVKFELVYTMGSQKPIELSPERWILIQAVLDLLPKYAEQVRERLPESIDYDDTRAQRYPRIRTLRDDGDEKLLDLLASCICTHGLPGLHIGRQPQELRKAILRYIRDAEPSVDHITAVEEGPFWTNVTKDALLLVRGLIGGGVLRFALRSKRYRVNYGIDRNRSPATKLAVPYRSKDSPSPRSEFSHPEVVIVLTSLTYYYGGLSDDDIFDAFAHLLQSDQADIEYGEWIHKTTIPAAFRHLASINIKDGYQCRTQVFPALRYSKGAIDYFLSHVVFPKEMKEFPYKLSASGWDIGAEKAHPVTGFSGTNDSRDLLPLSMHHLDLPTQEHTNALVLSYLLQQENSVHLLPRAANFKHLLEAANEIRAKVILDVGAQILDLNNLEVVKEWLKLSEPQVKAAVFFDDYEELSILDRTGKIESLQASPFAKQLDCCIIYLDEAHTRGTNLRLPRDYRAAVTLGANVTKDKLVQACMRMRKLGHGQSVAFCIPTEIQTKILECMDARTSDPSDIRVSDVLVWAITYETWSDLRRSIPLWATQGQRFEKHRHLLHDVETTKAQADGFLELEAETLEHRYRPRSHNHPKNRTANWDTTNENIARILNRCREFGITNFDSATLQEEQERELSPEIEQERQVQRPQPMAPEQHEIHQDLVRLVNTGVFDPKSSAYIPAFEALKSTSAANEVDLAQFPKDLLVTVEYIRTVQLPSGFSAQSYVSDSYHRPIQWILSVPRLETHLTNASESIIQTLIILSPFEADRLLDKIRQSRKVTLHLYAPRVNLAYNPLDQLQLYTVGRPFNQSSIPRSLIVQLNLFAGQLYFTSYKEYTEFCDHLGLATSSEIEGQGYDGFVKPPIGKWGLTESPVKFLKMVLMRVRRDGESADKTHVGKVLCSEMLQPELFE